MSLSVAAAAGFGEVTPVATAEAGASMQSFGQRSDLADGSVVQGWTVSDLKKSTDTIDYLVRGSLWEATATDEALQGVVVPVVSNFNARAMNGDNYRALFQVATPQGVNPALLNPGEKTSGKVYFDVTGDAPTAVVYSAGGPDLLTWTHPTAARQVGLSPAGSAKPAQQAPLAGPHTNAGTAPETANIAALPATQMPADAEVWPTTGWQGTPQPQGRQGTLDTSAQQAPAQPDSQLAADQEEPAEAPSTQSTLRPPGWTRTQQPPAWTRVPQPPEPSTGAELPPA
jgi:hypothetical protein